MNKNQLTMPKQVFDCIFKRFNSIKFIKSSLLNYARINHKAPFLNSLYGEILKKKPSRSHSFLMIFVRTLFNEIIILHFWKCRLVDGRSCEHMREKEKLNCIFCC